LPPPALPLLEQKDTNFPHQIIGWEAGRKGGRDGSRCSRRSERRGRSRVNGGHRSRGRVRVARIVADCRGRGGCLSDEGGMVGRGGVVGRLRSGGGVGGRSRMDCELIGMTTRWRGGREGGRATGSRQGGGSSCRGGGGSGGGGGGGRGGGHGGGGSRRPWRGSFLQFAESGQSV